MTTADLVVLALSLITALAAVLAWLAVRGLRAALDASARDGSRIEAAVRDEAATARRETAAQSAQGRGELAVALDRFGANQTAQAELLGRQLATQLATFAQQIEAQSRLSDERQAAQQAEARAAREQQQQSQAQALARFGEQLNSQFNTLAETSAQRMNELRATVESRLAAIQADNTAKLDEMRRTVDEKLHATLEQRLGESFKLVSDRLEQVHKGLGEMQTLAGSVGDLKRVMTNVKSRGTWGELQLGSIIDNVLTPEQYARNVKTVPDSDDLVEFAIRLPGRNDEHPVWLPIDAKYPVEHYQRLQDAQDSADRVGIVAAGNAFETSIRGEARKIASKYIAPPHTTDFAVMYLPSEGLFAEVLRRPGLVEALQNEHRIVITGPANLAAMLSSLQMGFKTLAIEKRSSEVWGVLGQVKTEFGKFGEVVEATRKSIDAAARKFDQVGVRTRAIQRHLRNVQELPNEAGQEQPLFPATSPGGDQTASEDEE